MMSKVSPGIYFLPCSAAVPLRQMLHCWLLPTSCHIWGPGGCGGKNAGSILEGSHSQAEHSVHPLLEAQQSVVAVQVSPHSIRPSPRATLS